MGEMTKADVRRAMTQAGFKAEYLDLALAREIADGERRWVSYSDLDEYRSTFDRAVTVFRLDDVAAWSSHSGSTYTRSNQRRLLADYPNRVAELGYNIGDSLIVLLAGLDEDLCQVLTGLKNDYAVYDESDMSELEHDLACEAWDDYLCMDLRADLGKVFTGDDGDPDLDTLDVPDDELRDLFYHKGEPDTGEHRETIEYEPEGADTVIFRDADKVTERIVEVLRQRWAARLAAAEAAAWAEELRPCDGQLEIRV